MPLYHNNMKYICLFDSFVIDIVQPIYYHSYHALLYKSFSFLLHMYTKCIFIGYRVARCRGHGLHEAGHQQAQGSAPEAGGGRGGAEPPHAHV